MSLLLTSEQNSFDKNNKRCLLSVSIPFSLALCPTWKHLLFSKAWKQSFRTQKETLQCKHITSSASPSPAPTPRHIFRCHTQPRRFLLFKRRQWKKFLFPLETEPQPPDEPLRREHGAGIAEPASRKTNEVNAASLQPQLQNEVRAAPSAPWARMSGGKRGGFTAG